MDIQTLVCKNSPFLPTITTSILVSTSLKYIQQEGYDPAPAIATAISESMSQHANRNLYPFLVTFARQGTTEQDIKMLELGYRYQLDTILASAVCKNTDKNQRVFLLTQIFKPTIDPLVCSLQATIRRDINATVNILNLDPSAAFIFKYLHDYPFSKNEYFLAGMEISSIIFFGVSQALTDAHPEFNWLKEWQGTDQT